MYSRQSLPISVRSLKSWPFFSALFGHYKDQNQNYSDDYIEDDDTGKGYYNFIDFYDLNSGSSREEDSPVQRVLTNEAYCFDVTRFAEKFVDAVIIEAKRMIYQKTKEAMDAGFLEKTIDLTGNMNNESKLTFRSSTRESYVSIYSASSYWPKISEFNIKLGQEKLENYVFKWERSDDWLYCVDFLGFESEDCSNIFVYEVEWSKPTMSYPIPQATASVFFALDVYKMVPHNYDRYVEVSYVFEGSNVIHKPGKIDFQEKWLQDILDAKLAFFKIATLSVPREHCSEVSTVLPQDDPTLKYPF